MKWEVKLEPKEGDTRILHKFAWLPFRMMEEGKSYVVWLENYASHQQYQTVMVSKWGFTEFRWVEQHRSLLWNPYC